ncbi:cellulose binding domain-containing protein [Dactylosporangium sp. NPDC051541]|uniref:cellulose binding domain-containing protein n=1 Tax=Dactylosporangium sp. NPDC051541 TaxID=3363977 RepID=UPI0037A0A793
MGAGLRPGWNAQADPALVQAEQAAGMWIGNHTWDHDNVSDKATAYIQSELQRTQDVIAQLTGTAPKLFRPPYGSTSAALKAVEAQYGLTEVLWDVDTQDWNNATTDAIVQAASTLTNGQVILMHDGFPNTIAAVPRIVAGLASRGLCAGMISTVTGRAVAPEGGATPATSTASRTPTAPSSPSPSRTTPSASASASAGAGGCTATYTKTGEWTGGFQADVKVTNTGSSTTTGWAVTLTFANGQRVTQVWNGRTASAASPYTVTNEAYNNAIPAGGSASFGLLGSWTASNSGPAVACTRTP